MTNVGAKKKSDFYAESNSIKLEKRQVFILQNAIITKYYFVSLKQFTTKV